jgi:hypothetical protein
MLAVLLAILAACSFLTSARLPRGVSPMSSEVVVILMLLAFIVGMMTGISLVRSTR